MMKKQKLKKFISLNKKDMLLLIEAFTSSGLYRLIILTVPFKIYRRYMGTYNIESSENINPNYIVTIQKIAWAVNITGKFSPWKSKCLVRALTAQKMLKKRSIDSTLYLGVKKGNQNKMEAHAWLRCGKFFITGGTIMNEFTGIAKFSTFGENPPVS